MDCERRLIAAAVGRAGEGAGIVDASLVERAIAAADRPLTAEQAMAVRATVSSGHGVDVIQALAGTGKTYTAGVLREVYESAGYRGARCRAHGPRRARAHRAGRDPGAHA